ncbi:hypothetical protein ACFQU1_04490 [Chelatococcus sp. GCM10030263]|uniref:hypothetical protein n=1 Tax=Chelatococcus sp. GCM10030263 TaxID=3273387 RepID=UPI00360EF8AF
MMNTEKFNVEIVKDTLQKIKSHVSDHGGRLSDDSVHELICTLKGSEKVLGSLYQVDFAAGPPPATFSSAAEAITWGEAEAVKLRMKLLIDCLLPQLAMKCPDGCRAPTHADEAIPPDTSMTAAEPALAVTTVGIAGSVPPPVDEPISL